MAVNFYLDKRTDKKGNSSIRVSITVRGARYISSTGYKIPPAKWDASKKQVRKGSVNAGAIKGALINSALAKIAEHFATFEVHCITNNIRPDTNALKEEFTQHFARLRAPNKVAPRVEFFDYFNKFTSEEGTVNNWTISTFTKFTPLKKHLREFNASLSFEDLDERKLTEFVIFLRDVKMMRNSSIMKALSLLKWYLRWATEKGYNTNTAFQSFTPKLKTTPKKVVFLEWTELMNVLHYQIPPTGTQVTLRDMRGAEYVKRVRDADAISKCRDIFCFCCFTSLRYSDAINLKWADVSGDVLTITTVKTSDTISIELNKYALSILKKYKDTNNVDGYVFPRVANQNMNVDLKDLCELCGINRPVSQTYYRGSKRCDETMPKFALITTHTGRRTFICNALMLGIPAEIVMKWTGHSDYKAMRPYIDIANSAKAKAMNLFNKI